MLSYSQLVDNGITRFEGDSEVSSYSERVSIVGNLRRIGNQIDEMPVVPSEDRELESQAASVWSITHE